MRTKHNQTVVLEVESHTFSRAIAATNGRISIVRTSLRAKDSFCACRHATVSNATSLSNALRMERLSSSSADQSHSRRTPVSHSALMNTVLIANQSICLRSSEPSLKKVFTKGFPTFPNFKRISRCAHSKVEDMQV